MVWVLQEIKLSTSQSQSPTIANSLLKRVTQPRMLAHVHNPNFYMWEAVARGLQVEVSFSHLGETISQNKNIKKAGEVAQYEVLVSIFRTARKTNKQQTNRPFYPIIVSLPDKIALVYSTTSKTGPPGNIIFCQFPLDFGSKH